MTGSYWVPTANNASSYIHRQGCKRCVSNAAQRFLVSGGVTQIWDQRFSTPQILFFSQVLFHFSLWQSKYWGIFFAQRQAIHLHECEKAQGKLNTPLRTAELVCIAATRILVNVSPWKLWSYCHSQYKVHVIRANVAQVWEDGETSVENPPKHKESKQTQEYTKCFGKFSISASSLLLYLGQVKTCDLLFVQKPNMHKPFMLQQTEDKSNIYLPLHLHWISINK